jgi:hypothetical protein
VREHGALEWVNLLHRQGWGQAIASAAPRANIETILDVLQASRCFQAIVSADDVHRGKPDPEVFLIAATRLGVAPEHCIVVRRCAARRRSRPLRRNEKHRRKPELQAFAGRCGGAIARPSGSERLQHFVTAWRVIGSYPRLSFSSVARNPDIDWMRMRKKSGSINLSPTLVCRSPSALSHQ